MVRQLRFGRQPVRGEGSAGGRRTRRVREARRRRGCRVRGAQAARTHREAARRKPRVRLSSRCQEARRARLTVSPSLPRSSSVLTPTSVVNPHARTFATSSGVPTKSVKTTSERAASRMPALTVCSRSARRTARHESAIWISIDSSGVGRLPATARVPALEGLESGAVVECVQGAPLRVEASRVGARRGVGGTSCDGSDLGFRVAALVEKRIDLWGRTLFVRMLNQISTPTHHVAKRRLCRPPALLGRREEFVDRDRQHGSARIPQLLSLCLGESVSQRRLEIREHHVCTTGEGSRGFGARPGSRGWLRSHQCSAVSRGEVPGSGPGATS